MSIETLLDDLLTAQGYPPFDAPSHILGEYARPREPYGGDLALLEPLRRRGWCTHFDAEGQFFMPGEHSQLIAALLTLAGVHPLPSIRDTWLRGVGWVLEIEDGSRRMALHAPEPGTDLPSDYCALPLVKALVEDWLGPDHVLLEPVTGDQTAFCCMMPRPVFAELCAVGVIDPESEEGGEPSPDRLVLPPVWEDDAERIVRLSAAEADAMLTGAPRDWLAGL